MAKQTFTTGQVLTAAQMTSLQQTAMGGGSTTAKTTSYVLVATDAGTTVAMNAAGSTTITVNTGLFSAGDSVFIQNWGAGTTTVTAGTATVTTHGSLALGQWEGGQLYFTSSSAAIFFDISQSAGMTNPMTTTGDTIYSSSGSTPARLGIGTTGQILTVAGGVPTWATATAAGTSWSLLNSGGTALTGASTITVSGISGKDKIMILFKNASATTAGETIKVRLNTDSGSNYYSFGPTLTFSSSYNAGNFQAIEGDVQTAINCATMSTGADSRVTGSCLITGCNSSGTKIYQSIAGATQGSGNGATPNFLGGYYDSSSTISSISMVASGSGSFDQGTVYVYTSA